MCVRQVHEMRRLLVDSTRQLSEAEDKAGVATQLLNKNEKKKRAAARRH